MDLGSAARIWTDLSLNTLAGIAGQPKAPHAARVAAASELLDRGWGRAPQSATVNGEIKITLRKMLGDDFDDEKDAPP